MRKILYLEQYGQSKFYTIPHKNNGWAYFNPTIPHKKRGQTITLITCPLERGDTIWYEHHLRQLFIYLLTRAIMRASRLVGTGAIAP